MMTSIQPAQLWAGKPRLLAMLCAASLLAAPVAAQVLTVDTKAAGPTAVSANAPVDRRYQQIQPTAVQLPKESLDPRSRMDLLRALDSEQGFAMRPFPRGHKGLKLVANGKLEPAGEAYLTMATHEGISANPGDRLVLTDVRVEKSSIIFDLNGGPDHKHAFLRHIQIGAGPTTNPVVRDDDVDPVGARLTLEFNGPIPQITADQVKALLAPMISFGLKTPIQAFTDTLPPVLKEAILSHHVMVGMSTEMVLFAKGAPVRKSREMDGLMPFEEWIYGQAPQEVDFVRINGNRVIRVEIAKVGEPPVIFTTDEVSGLMRTDGTPVLAKETKTRTVAEGDSERDPDKQAPAPPPSLKNPGETLPDTAGGHGDMRPVRFPEPKPDTPPDSQTGTQPDSSTGAQPSAQQPVPDASQPAPTKLL